MRDYALQIGNHSLKLGAALEPDRQDQVDNFPNLAVGWELQGQHLTAREIVEQLDSLFEAVCQKLGPTADRTALLEALQATLSIEGREAALPLMALDFDDSLRREFAGQASHIGKAISAWAVEINEARTGLTRHGVEALEKFELRSHCDGHLWTSRATAVLTGPAGGPQVMQLYNEWLHQCVLLRDMLLPFDNWTEVRICLRTRRDAVGLRKFEPARSAFLADFFTRLLSHAAIVRFAHSLFANDEEIAERPSDFYGFQTDQGAVLPSAIGGSNITQAPKGLLSWHAARIVDSPAETTVIFQYAWTDYFAAPRSQIDERAVAPPPDGDARLSAEPIGEYAVILWLVLDADTVAYSIDLGQCLRGQRYAYQPTPRQGIAPLQVVEHDIGGVLSQHGLLTAKNGIHLLPTKDNAIVQLALLGKIYPENTILGDAAPWAAVLSAGKAYGAKFVVGAPL